MTAFAFAFRSAARFAKTKLRRALSLSLTLLASADRSARADVFMPGAGLTGLDFVTVGNPGNLPDTTGFGQVDSLYRIGKYEVTNAQYIEFLNAKATIGDPYGLYSGQMSSSGPGSGISRTGVGIVGDPYVYSFKGGDTNWANRPVNWVTFWDAARFCNWLQNGPTSAVMRGGRFLSVRFGCPVPRCGARTITILSDRGVPAFVSILGRQVARKFH